MKIDEEGDGFFDREWSKYHLTEDEIKTMDLTKVRNKNQICQCVTTKQLKIHSQGRNLARYFVPTLDVEIKFNVYLYGQSERLVITDIDGTITTSNTKGFIYAQLGIEVEHRSVVRLFHTLQERNYTVMYLTARSMGMDSTTRKYLFEVRVCINNTTYFLANGSISGLARR